MRSTATRLSGDKGTVEQGVPSSDGGQLGCHHKPVTPPEAGAVRTIGRLHHPGTAQGTASRCTSASSGFYPSLHLNLGDVYGGLGDLDRARDHLERGRMAVGALADDGYGQMIEQGLERLAGRLDTAQSAQGVWEGVVKNLIMVACRSSWRPNG
jgi:hypothetical protein